MIDVDQEYTREVECEYKGEKYKVRDNGAILRIARDGKPKRPKDETWTFGESINRGYVSFCSEAVHRIVATAFWGEAPSNQHVVDHIDTNRQNNRPENLRWVTKLENILLNPFTKTKIEYWCGSVESFLEDPSQLKGHENEDKNFAWMRAVTQEEAQNTLANWQNILNKPRPETKSSQNAIQEWIFKQNGNYSKGFDILDNFDPITKAPVSTPLSKMVPNVPPAPIKIEKMKQKEQPISKTEFMAAILEICEVKGWKYKKYYKAENWKADILISTNNQSIAISIYKSIAEAKKSLPPIERDGVKIYGLILSPKIDDISEIACFSLHRNENSMDVTIANNKTDLTSFLKKGLEGKIEHLTSSKITAIDVIFEQIDCWRCHKQHFIPFVRYLVSEKGLKHDYAEIDYKDIPDLRFGDDFLEIVQKYILEHPQKGYVMGEVKPRHSQTLDEDYMSYGCPECNAIVGDFYLNDLEANLMYETDENRMDRIHLKTPFEIPVTDWLIKD